MLAAALFPVPFLLWRAPAWWSVPLVAPLLGLVSLAGAFPALAGQASTGWRRAVVGALAAWWLLLAEPLAARTLLLGRAPGVRPHGRVGGARRAPWSSTCCARCATSGAVAIIALWAPAAFVLPYLIRGRRRRSPPPPWAPRCGPRASPAGTALIANAVHTHAGTSTAALLGAALAAPLALASQPRPERALAHRTFRSMAGGRTP